MKRTKIILGLSALTLLCGAFAIAPQSAAMVSAEGETSQTTSEDTNVELPAEIQEEISYWKKLYDQFLVPLLGGVSITAVLSALVNIALSVAMHLRKKKFLTIQSENFAKYAELAEKAEKLASSAETLAKSMKESSESSEKLIKSFIEDADELIEGVAKLSGNVEKLHELKGKLADVAEILGKMASHTQELVSTGVAEDIERLLREIKEVRSDGKE